MTWDNKNPHASLQHVHNSPKENVFCDNQISFMEKTINDIVYLNMLKNILNPQLDEDNQAAFLVPAK